tara:strand:- start:55 stop:1062 length:1008 start_codon:yes stop_codon:yes gene_type:complete
MDNVPANFNHVLDFPADEYKRLKTIAIDTIHKILIKHEHDSEIDENIIHCFKCIVNPTEYLNDKSHMVFNIRFYEGHALPITIPGPKNDWDSLHHLIYVSLFAIQETRAYEFYYCVQSEAELENILNELNQSSMMGVATRLRNPSMAKEDRWCLNDIVHTEDPSEYHNEQERWDINIKGPWTPEVKHAVRRKIIDILNKYPDLRPKLEEHEDKLKRHEMSIIYRMHQEIVQILAMNEQKLHNIRYDIRKAGGHAGYVKNNEISYTLNAIQNKVKAALYDELMDKLQNEWVTNGKIKRGVKKIQDKCTDSCVNEAKEIRAAINEGPKERLINQPID